MEKKSNMKKPTMGKKTSKKPHGQKKSTKKLYKRRRKLTKIKSELNPSVRRCIVDEVASTKGSRKLTKGEKRALFDAALRRCLRH